MRCCRVAEASLGLLGRLRIMWSGRLSGAKRLPSARRWSAPSWISWSAQVECDASVGELLVLGVLSVLDEHAGTAEPGGSGGGLGEAASTC